MDDLSPLMLQVLTILKQGPSTSTLVGAELTGRRSAYGPQTSAREGGRTLHALKRRGLVTDEWNDFRRKWLWSLTAQGKEWCQQSTPTPKDRSHDSK